MEAGIAWMLRLVALAGSASLLAGCSGPSDAHRERLADVEVRMRHSAEALPSLSTSAAARCSS